MASSFYTKQLRMTIFVEFSPVLQKKGPCLYGQLSTWSFKKLYECTSLIYHSTLQRM